MQYALRTVARQLDRARAMRREPAFENMARRRANELARFVGEQLVDRARVLPLDRFAGQDHRAAIDIAALEAGVLVSAVDEELERLRVDRTVGQERREHDRRAPQHLAVNHREAARQAFALA